METSRTTPNRSTFEPSRQQKNKISADERDTFRWFAASSWCHDVLKFLFVSSVEARNSAQFNTIEEQLNGIESAINQLKEISFTTDEENRICTENVTNYRRFRDYHSDRARDELLAKIGHNTLLRNHSEFFKRLQKMTNQERSTLRAFLYQRIEATVKIVNNEYETFRRDSESNKQLETQNEELKREQQNLKSILTGEFNQKLHLLRQESESEKQALQRDFESSLQRFRNAQKEASTKNTRLENEKSNMLVQLQKTQEETSNLRKENSSLQQENSTLLEENSKLEESNTEKQQTIGELIDRIHAAQEEASRYQAALGTATNVEWKDGDPNSSLEIVKDIEKIQLDLQIVTKTKGKTVEINELAVQELLKEYRTKTSTVKLLISCALQRFIIETVFNSIEELCESVANTISDPDDDLEACIILNTDRLVQSTLQLSETRLGNDALTSIVPIKVRQHVYAALASRGFNKEGHTTIENILNSITKKLEKHRVIKEKTYQQTFDFKIVELVTDLLHLHFRLKAQEPIPNIRWIQSGEEIHEGLMEGSWDNVADFEVDLCYFPVIGIDLDDNKNRRVYSKAKVLVRSKYSTQSMSGIEYGSQSRSLYMEPKHSVQSMSDIDFPRSQNRRPYPESVSERPKPSFRSMNYSEEKVLASSLHQTPNSVILYQAENRDLALTSSVISHARRLEIPKTSTHNSDSYDDRNQHSYTDEQVAEMSMSRSFFGIRNPISKVTNMFKYT